MIGIVLFVARMLIEWVACVFYVVSDLDVAC